MSDRSPEEMSVARADDVVRDIERRLPSQRILLSVTRWLALPLMLVALLAMVVGLVLGFGEPGAVIGGAIGIAGGAVALASWARGQDDEIGELQANRDSLLKHHPQLDRESRGRIAEGGVSRGRDGQKP